MPIIPFIPLIGAGLGAAGNILGGTKGARTSESANNTSGTFQDTSSTTGNTSSQFDSYNRGDSLNVVRPADQPEYAGLRDMLISTATNRLGAGSGGLIPGIQATGLQNINRGADLAHQSLQNRLTSRGLGGTAVEGAGLSNLEDRRYGSSNQFLNVDVPRMARDFENQDFDMAASLLGFNRPTLTTTGQNSAIAGGNTAGTSQQDTNRSGSSTGLFSGSSVAPGSTTGNALGSIGDLLGFLYGAGMLGGGR